MNYQDIAQINLEKDLKTKQGMKYLPWARAWDQIMRIDPTATFKFKEEKWFAETVMVYCSLTVQGVTRTAHLPVMDFKNKAIVNPNAMDINKAMQRCLVKACALFGLGLYVYEDESLPDPKVETNIEAKTQEGSESVAVDYESLLDNIATAVDKESLHAAYMQAQQALPKGDPRRLDIVKAKDLRKTELGVK